MTSTGIRELKDNLSRYIRRIEAGERTAITAHGRVVPELVPPLHGLKRCGASRFDQLVAAGVSRFVVKPNAGPITLDLTGTREFLADLFD